jgi:hypothetical protein
LLLPTTIGFEYFFIVSSLVRLSLRLYTAYTSSASKLAVKSRHDTDLNIHMRPPIGSAPNTQQLDIKGKT